MLRWIVRIDQHPPLYYALLHGWMRLVGDSEFAVRTLSALFGTLTVPVIYRLARRIAGKTAGLLAALILAVSPFHVRFAQEARMYTLLALEAALALYAVAIISLPQPETPNPQPPTPNPQPATPNSQPPTPNPKPATPNSQPQTLNPKPATPNSQPQTLNPKPATPNSQPPTRNSQLSFTSSSPPLRSGPTTPPSFSFSPLPSSF
jgi:outer membrane biosynthesis protein TonB